MYADLLYKKARWTYLLLFAFFFFFCKFEKILLRETDWIRRSSVVEFEEYVLYCVCCRWRVVIFQKYMSCLELKKNWSSELMISWSTKKDQKQNSLKDPCMNFKIEVVSDRITISYSCLQDVTKGNAIHHFFTRRWTQYDFTILKDTPIVLYQARFSDLRIQIRAGSMTLSRIGKIVLRKID